MMHYRQSIALFGLALPLFLGLAVLGIAMYAKSSVQAGFDEVNQQAKQYSANLATANGLEQQIAKRREYQKQWDDLFKERPIAQINAHVGRLEKALNKEFQRSNTEESTAAMGFATLTTQKSSQIQQSYRGTFRGIQQALLDIETHMPQLQLNELNIEPVPQAGSNQIAVTAKFTAWEK